MSAAVVRGVVRHLGPSTDTSSDADLIAAFAGKRDPDAFATILARHGPTVFGVCRRVLGDAHEAEDAFQAVFLVLARKVASVSPPGSVGGWLYGVAVRTAKKAKVAATRRRRREMIAAAQASRVSETPCSAEHAELRTVLDEELARLQDVLRAAIVLCDLHGKTRAEAAAELGCPEGTIAARLHRGRKKLAEALSRRGLALPATGLATVLVPATISASATDSVLAIALGSVARPAVLSLAREVIRSMTATRNTLAIGVLTLVAGGLLAATGMWASTPIHEPQPSPSSTAEATPEQPGDSKVKPPDDNKPKPGSGYVSDLRFSLDGKQYAVVASGIVTVHDTATRKELWKVAGEAVGFLPDGKALITMGEKKVTRHDKDTGKVTKEFPRPKSNSAWHKVAFSPDGKRYAAHFGFNVRVYDIETGFEPIRLDEQHELGSSVVQGATGPDLSFSEDSGRVYAVGVLVAQGRVMGTAGWNLETGRQIFSITHKDGPRTVAFSGDDRSFAFGYQDRVDFWLSQKDPVKSLPLVGAATVMAISPDGKLLAVGVRRRILNGTDPGAMVLGYKSEVQVLEVQTGKEVRRFDGFERDAATTDLAVSAIAFSPDGSTLLAGTNIQPFEQFPDNKAPKAKTGEVKVWNLDGPAPAQAQAKWREKAVLKDCEDLVVSVAVAPDGKTFVAGAAGGNVSVWNAADHKLLKLFNYDSRRAHDVAVAYSHDGQYLATTAPGGAYVVDAVTFKPVFTADVLGGESVTLVGNATPLAIAFGPTEDIQGKKLNRLAMTDGRKLFAKMWFDGARPSSANFGPLAGGPKIEGIPPASVAYSDDAKQLVFIPNAKMNPDGTLGKPDPAKDTHWIAQVWGGGSGTPMKFLLHGTSPVTAVAWSKDGKWIATGAADGEIVLWDGKTFKEARRLKVSGRGGKSPIHAIAFTNDGKTLATACEIDEGKIMIAYRVAFFDVATGERGQDLRDFPNAPPLAVAFSADGKTLVVGCGYRDAESRKLTKADREKAGEVRVFTTEPAPPQPGIPPVGDPANPTGRQWKQKKTILPANEFVSSIAFAPDGKSFATATTDGKLRGWDAATLQKLWETKLDGVKFPALTYQSADRQIFVTTPKGVAMIDARTGKSTGLWEKALDGNAITYSWSAQRLAVSDGRWTLVLNPQKAPGSGPVPPQHDIAILDGPPEEILGKQPPLASGVAWSPDGKRLALLRLSAVLGGKPAAVVWGGKREDGITSLLGHTEQVTAVAWSDSIVNDHPRPGESGKGKRLLEKPLVDGVIATGGKDGQVIFWDGETLKEMRRIKIEGRNGSSTIRTLAFSPNGRTLAAGVELDAGKGADRVVMIDTITGKEIDFLQVYSSLSTVAWSPDGNTLITACGLRPWDNRELTDEERKVGGEIVIWERARN